MALVEQAARSQSVCMDCYPYVASSTMLLPARVAVSRDVRITWSKVEPAAAGRSLFTMAAERGIDPTTLATQLVPGGAIYFAMSDEDVDRILAHPLVMIGSDGLPHDPVPHPRLWGTFCACAGALRAPTPAAGARRRGAQDDGPARTPLWAGHTRRTARRRCR